MHQCHKCDQGEEDDEIRGSNNCCIGCSVIAAICIAWGLGKLVVWVISLFS